MINLSQKQLVSVWSDLEQAYFKKNRFGGNTAEIYAYRFHGHSPTLAAPCAESGFLYDLQVEQYRECAKTFVAVLEWFAKERNCKIFIDDLTLSAWKRKNKEFVHRAHVRIEPKRT